jgi:hypothetical protein
MRAQTLANLTLFVIDHHIPKVKFISLLRKEERRVWIIGVDICPDAKYFATPIQVLFGRVPAPLKTASALTPSEELHFYGA